VDEWREISMQLADDILKNEEVKQAAGNFIEQYKAAKTVTLKVELLRRSHQKSSR
jgi:hypothetical protein